jgi:putative Mg2+ transporter-C (MgtC) family protein
MELNAGGMALRLCLAFAAGGIIGFERSSRHQVAGLRTHILIAVGAALLMILSIWIPQEFLGAKNGDPGRIAAQVVSGIGFLGAGAIIRLGNNIKGLTTAASLWLVAAVGLALGAGLYIAAAIAEGISLFTLVFMDLFEKRLFPAERNKVLELFYKTSNPDAKEALDVLRSYKIRIQSFDMDESFDKKTGKNKVGRIRLLVGIPDTADISALTKSLEGVKKLSRVEMREKF